MSKFDELTTLVNEAKFHKGSGVRDSRKKMNKRGKTPQILFFGPSISHLHKDDCMGSRCYPEIEKLLREISHQYFPDHLYSNIQINKNMECLPHFDKLNLGMSVIFSFGDFTDGHLMIDGLPHDIYHKPKRFNGSLHEHYTQGFTGNRYVAIYYLNSRNFHDTVCTRLQCESPADFKTVDEIWKRKIYGTPGEGETWLDIGANIGTFSLWCQHHGARAIAFEPENRNYEKLAKINPMSVKAAVGPEYGYRDLYVSPNNTWRHTLYPTRGRSTQRTKVESCEDMRADGIKIDAEGSEVDIIMAMKYWPPILVFEFDGGIHKKVSDYVRLIDYLKSKYTCVRHPKAPDCDEFSFFPNGLLVRCSGPREISNKQIIYQESMVSKPKIILRLQPKPICV